MDAEQILNEQKQARDYVTSIKKEEYVTLTSALDHSMVDIMT